MIKSKLIDEHGKLDIYAIMALLPHRYPMLLVDRVLSFEIEKSLTAIKNVTANEPVFTGHFPDYPVYPGVLMVEALAQASGILSIITNEQKGYNEPGKEYLYLFAGIDNVRFKRQVIPGDQLRLQVDVKKHRKDVAKFLVAASVDGELACSANILSMRKVMDHDESDS